MRVRLKEGKDHPPGWEGWDEFEIFGGIKQLKSTLIFRNLPTKKDEFLDARVASTKFVQSVLSEHYETIEKPNARPRKRAPRKPRR